MIKNRRRGPDTLVKVITISSVVSWLIVAVVVILLTLNQSPQSSSSYFYRHTSTGGGVPETGVKILLFANLVLCTWGIYANLTRKRRKSDRIHTALLVSTLITAVGLILSLLFL